MKDRLQYRKVEDLGSRVSGLGTRFLRILVTHEVGSSGVFRLFYVVLGCC